MSGPVPKIRWRVVERHPVSASQTSHTIKKKKERRKKLNVSVLCPAMSVLGSTSHARWFLATGILERAQGTQRPQGASAPELLRASTLSFP